MTFCCWADDILEKCVDQLRFEQMDFEQVTSSHQIHIISNAQIVFKCLKEIKNRSKLDIAIFMCDLIMCIDQVNVQVTPNFATLYIVKVERFWIYSLLLLLSVISQHDVIILQNTSFYGTMDSA